MGHKGLIENVLRLLCLVSPFTFVFCLIRAIRDAVHGGKNEMGYGLAASLSLLALVAAIVYIK